ncbi:MAG: sulfate respiration complex protein HmcC [bacterium]
MSNPNHAASEQGAGARLITPFHVVAGIIVAIGLYITYRRFTGGLGAVTHLDNNNPWGLWIGFDLLCGVALAAGGYVTAAAVYLFGSRKYHGAVRPAVLTAFLGYSLVVLALLYDVGRPWRLHYPFAVQPGTSSVLFEVGLCVMVYLFVLFLEFTPIPLEWLGMRKIRNVMVKLTIGLTIIGVVLSTMHQSSLGALYLLVPYKLHPLWYSSYLPIFFFISSIVAGLSMVIFESTLSHRAFAGQLGERAHEEHDELVLGFGKAASLVLFGYFGIKWIGVSAGNHWNLLLTPYGLWFLLEMLGFVLLPCFLYAFGYRERDVRVIQAAAVISILGVVLNRFNVSLVAFNWHLPLSQRYFPSWMEILLSVFVVTVGLIAFRFIVSRMPVLREHPDFQETH